MIPNNNRSDNPNGRRHFKYGFNLFIKPSRVKVLRKMLKDQGLKPDKHFVLSNIRTDTRRYVDPIIQNFVKNQDIAGQWTISFKAKDHATLFKISWVECDSEGLTSTLPKIILPIIRRTKPMMIANEIIGVQPMSSNTSSDPSSIFSLGTPASSSSPKTTFNENQSDLRLDE